VPLEGVDLEISGALGDPCDDGKACFVGAEHSILFQVLLSGWPVGPTAFGANINTIVFIIVQERSIIAVPIRVFLSKLMPSILFLLLPASVIIKKPAHIIKNKVIKTKTYLINPVNKF